MEQSGVLATLSRWRSWVQIPSGTLCYQGQGAVRKQEKRRSSNLREFVGSTPTRATRQLIESRVSWETREESGTLISHSSSQQKTTRVGWALASLSDCNPPAFGHCRFNSIRDYSRLCPDTPTGRATRLKPECLQVRILLWVLQRKTATAR